MTPGVDEAKLEQYLRTAWLDGPREGGLSLERLAGGKSNLTYRVRFGARDFVLRRPPVTSIPGAHDVRREHLVLSRVHPVYPLAPKPLLLCRDPSVVGERFFLMELRPGRRVRADEVSPRTFTTSMVQALRDLHAIDSTQHGLGDIGMGPGFLARQLKGLGDRWERVVGPGHAVFEGVAGRLRERLPTTTRAAVTHNDFKPENLLIDDDRVSAVVDWELCTVGDPLLDLGILLAYWVEPDDPPARDHGLPCVSKSPRWPRRNELTDEYARAANADLRDMAFYEGLGLLHLAVILRQLHLASPDERLDLRAEGLLESASGRLSLS